MENILNVLVAQNEWAILVVRLALGVIFIAHGWRKAHGFPKTVEWLQGEGFKPGWFWAFVVTAVELGGGVLILLGLFVQPVAVILAINMMVAFAWNYKKGNGFFQHLELDLILIAVLLLTATLGSGMYALGNLL